MTQDNLQGEVHALIADRPGGGSFEPSCVLHVTFDACGIRQNDHQWPRGALRSRDELEWDLVEGLGVASGGDIVGGNSCD